MKKLSAHRNKLSLQGHHASKLGLKSASKLVSSFHHASLDVEHFRSFVPLGVQEAMANLSNRYDTPPDEHSPSVMLFVDVSGFTKLSVKLSKEARGAEKLAITLNDFFAVVITEVERFGGDVTKFSGDAVTIRWRYKKSKQHRIIPLGLSPDALMDISDDGEQNAMALLVLHATACSLSAHASCKKYCDSSADIPALGLHSCVGAGQCTAVHIGGGNGRWEYVIFGDVMRQIAEGMHHSERDDTVLSAQAWLHLAKWHRQGLISAMSLPQDCFNVQKFDVDVSKLPLPIECMYPKHKISAREVLLLARYIPGAVYRAIVDNNDALLHGEMRQASAMFIKINGIAVADVTNDMLCKLMELVQSCCYVNEGVVNKLLVDDKGLLILVVFGLPPMAHMDDPGRAVATAQQICQSIDSWGLQGSKGEEAGETFSGGYARAMIGVASGNMYCGVTGAECEAKIEHEEGYGHIGTCGKCFHARQEYTVLGMNVNLAARLMSQAKPGHVCVCDKTEAATRELFVFEKQPSVVLKGINEGRPIDMYQVIGSQGMSAEEGVCGATSFELALAGASSDHGDFHDQHGHTHWDLGVRKAEREYLHEMFVAQRLKGGGTIMITGGWGTAKSLLATSLVKKAKHDACTAATATSDPLFAVDSVNSGEYTMRGEIAIDEQGDLPTWGKLFDELLVLYAKNHCPDLLEKAFTFKHMAKMRLERHRQKKKLLPTRREVVERKEIASELTLTLNAVSKIQAVIRSKVARQRMKAVWLADVIKMMLPEELHKHVYLLSAFYPDLRAMETKEEKEVGA
jgi:class 3 adenylate cyclase